jgi:hypothetical protein
MTANALEFHVLSTSDETQRSALGGRISSAPSELDTNQRKPVVAPVRFSSRGGDQFREPFA